MICREFNAEYIVQKTIIKNNAMYESNLDALRSSSMKGYPSGLQKFIINLKKDPALVVLLMFS